VFVGGGVKLKLPSPLTDVCVYLWQVRDTKMNAESSRSHQILRIYIESRPATLAGDHPSWPPQKYKPQSLLSSPNNTSTDSDRDGNKNEGWVSPGRPDAAEGVPGLSGSLRSPQENSGTAPGSRNFSGDELRSVSAPAEGVPGKPCGHPVPKEEYRGNYQGVCGQP
jgi:hypothetical protein